MKHLKTFENYEPINEELGVKDILLSGLASIILSFGMAGNSQAKNNKPTAETELSQKKDAKSKSEKITAELNSDQQKLVSDFIKWCKGKGKAKFDYFETQEDKEGKKQALDILIESFCDDMGFEGIDEQEILSTVFDIKNISVEIK
jgi:hypothetical protein